MEAKSTEGQKEQDVPGDKSSDTASLETALKNSVTTSKDTQHEAAIKIQSLQRVRCSKFRAFGTYTIFT